MSAATPGQTRTGFANRALALAERVVPKPAAWAFAFRIWLAMILALYAAFWLQLSSASSAAVCVAILAQPKRGQALSKALYRFLGTLVVALGGLARLLGLALTGLPSLVMMAALAVELGVTPLLCLWQARVAARSTETAGPEDTV